MKIRFGWVSNSSSSSFICDVCGAEQSGWDLCLIECEMCECNNGHIFCIDHLLTENFTEEVFQKICDKFDLYDLDYKEVKNNLSSFIYEEDDLEVCIPEELCPICQMESFKKNDLMKYIEKSNSNFLKEIKEKFSSYKEFKEFIK